MAEFPDPQWFLALGRLMAAEGESFRRLGYAEVRFAIKVLSDDGSRCEAMTGLEISGYELSSAISLDDKADYDPDFVICGTSPVWRRMLDEIERDGRPELRHTLSSLALVGEELWLESGDQLREDRFYRFNQTLQELFNLASKLPR
ncbi:MAG TPA: hypothetical protein VJN94_11545 [Candidatus Binataceae bacterium]|nr:hypothetical protein [Candidatus Binataceae bacterium]